MKKPLVLIVLVSILYSCTKPSDTTTNVTNNYGSSQPPFIINGLTDITFTNGVTTSYSLDLSVEYTDSSQVPVTLSLSQLPAGITIDTSWISSGTPSFNTSLTLYDTTAAGATPGVYTMTLTATSVNTKKTYTFNIKVLPTPPCSSYIVGTYPACTSYCSTYTYYADTVYADATINDKIWFKNFDGTGNLVYALITSCATTSSNEIIISIPAQTLNGVTYAGSGYGLRYYSQISITLTSPYNCQFTEQL